MPQIEKIEEITDDLRAYLDTNIKLIKLEAASNASEIGSGMISGIILGVVGLLFLLFLSLATAVYLSNFFDSNLLGIAAVSGFYLVLGLGMFLGRKKLFIAPLRNMITRKIFDSK
jgi:hypothetical protein